MAEFQLQANSRSRPETIVPEALDAVIDLSVLVAYNDTTPRQEIINSLKRIIEKIALAKLASP